MTKPTIRFALPLLALLLVFALPCRADDADKDKPINYSSDTGGADQSNGTGDLTGNVTITQGTLVLHADRITFKRNPDNSFSAIAYGNPVSYRQKREGSDEYDEAYAQRIVYDGQKQLVELFDATLRERGDHVRTLARAAFAGRRSRCRHQTDITTLRRTVYKLRSRPTASSRR